MSRPIGYAIWASSLVDDAAAKILAGADQFESVDMGEILERIRLVCIQRVRAREKDVTARAAARLGMNRSTLRYQLKPEGGR